VLTVIDYDAGNLRSVETALHHLGTRFVLTGDSHVLTRATQIILPGVGDARAAMENLSRTGLAEILRAKAAEGLPILGICLGSQIILERSEENDATCLGLLPGKTVAFGGQVKEKVPHMGWNTLTIRRDHPLFTDIPDDAAFYFVHSYYPQPTDRDDVFATTSYGREFPSVVGRNNVIATQFHPEKSGEFGLRMLHNFLNWKGRS